MKSSILRRAGRAARVGECPIDGKHRYATKADAKAAARQIKGRQGRLNAYRCGDWWHLGHLPSEVTRGKRARDQIKPPRPEEIS